MDGWLRVTVVAVGALMAGSAAYAQDISFNFAFGNCGHCGAGELGTDVAATDGFDEDYDIELLTWGALGYAGLYREAGIDGWDGPTAYYWDEMRAPLELVDEKVWQPICVWADPIYIGETIDFSFELYELSPPYGERTYELELIAVPEGVDGAPPVGTVWTVEIGVETTMTIPVYRTEVGLEGYQFAFRAIGTPPPCDGYAYGDSDCDGSRGFDDIAPFIAALGGEASWLEHLGGAADCDFLCVNDLDQDGDVDFDDIGPFVDCLGGACP